MNTKSALRFDIELRSTGHNKNKLEKLLEHVKGLAFSPTEIVNSCPCIIAINISDGASKKLKHYLDLLGAKVVIRRHGQIPLPPQLYSSGKNRDASQRNIQSASGQQTLNETQIVHKSAVPVPSSQMPPASFSGQKSDHPNTNSALHQSPPATHPATHTTTATTITLKRSVNDMMRSLQDKDWTVRELAVLELGETPSNGILRQIAKMLKDDVWRVRCAALDVLSKTGSGSVIKDITRCIHDDVWHVRYRAIEALGRMESDKAVKPLLHTLDDENWQVRQRAVQMLGDTRSEKALGGVLACLRDNVWHVRESAAKSLAKLRSEKSIKALIYTLQDPSWHVRSMAVTALWNIGSERAVNALIDVFHDENWMVRWKAAYALGKIGSANILAVLGQMEKKAELFLHEASKKALSSMEVIVETKSQAVARLEYRAENEYETMRYIPPEYFLMGHNEGEENARPAHKVYLDGFFIDTYEVTNSQYKCFDPSHEYPPEMDVYPVVNITWEEANAYAEWAGKRLPTEAEWEKAARGFEGRIFPWGNEFDPSKCNTEESANRSLTPVNQYPGGRSCFGVGDMLGNVLEWTADRYKPYPVSQYDSPDFAENFIVLRGGSWIHEGLHLACFTRLYAPPDNRNNFIGFRCARDIQ